MTIITLSAYYNIILFAFLLSYLFNKRHLYNYFHYTFI